MNLLVHNAHNGATYEIPKPVRFSSLAKLKLHIHENCTDETIGVESIILLTSFGIKLDFQMVNDMQELFLFDRRLFQKTGGALLAAYLAQEPPPHVTHESTAISAGLGRVTSQINIMFRSLNIIFNFATNFIAAAEKVYDGYGAEFRQLETSLHETWKKHYSDLRKFPLVIFKNLGSLSLSSLLREEELEAALAYAQEHIPPISLQYAALGKVLQEAHQMKVEIDRLIERLRAESVQKFQKKADIVARLEQKGGQNEGHELLQQAVDFKGRLSEESAPILAKIALLQMKSVDVKNGCKKLFDKNELSALRKKETLLSMTVDLPLFFGFVLIEQRRQYEWADYFSKGIVHNLSEQMTVLAENERKFQTLWNKRFSSMAETVGAHVQAQVPSLDMTLVNSSPKPLFSWLNFRLEREDISNYIESIKCFSLERSFLLLERNFKDLVVSTGKLKNTTKTIASLSLVEYGSQMINDDESQVKGLKSRIKKLEDLLHQQQYKNLDAWPVVLTNDSKTVLFERERPKISHHFSEPNNPILLLGLERKTPKLDASVTIDKHLDNIRLKRELKEQEEAFERRSEKLYEQREVLEKRLQEAHLRDIDTKQRIADVQQRCLDAETEKTHLQTRCTELKSECDSLRGEKAKAEDRLALSEKKLKEMETYCEEIKQSENAAEKKLGDLEEKYRALQKSHEQQKTLDSQSKEEVLAAQISTLLSQNSDLSSNISEVKSVNSELLSNMRAKEAEFRTERSHLTSENTRVQAENESLRTQVESKTEDFEALMEVMQGKSRKVEELLQAANTSFAGIFDGTFKLLSANMAFFYEFCEILESMGLLLVQENQEYRIRRVKGLRSKKDKKEAYEVDVGGQKKSYKSAVVDEMATRFAWVQQLQKVVQADDEDEIEAVVRANVEACRELGPKIHEFLLTITFKNEENEENEEELFFFNAILKRFRDVEGFAKKLTKESKQSNKITVSNFQQNDLVLFLPTKEVSGKAPWAAFNIDAPHYFLKTSEELSDKEYILRRIARIEEHVVQEGEENPYNLSPGLRWFMVSVSSETP